MTNTIHLAPRFSRSSKAVCGKKGATTTRKPAEVSCGECQVAGA